MPDLLEKLAPSAPRSRTTAWILAQLPRNTPEGKARAISIIVAVIATIAWVDYITGPRISFALFYLSPIALTLIWLGWRWACVAAVGSVVVRVLGDLASGGYNAPPLTVFWNRFVELSFYLIVIRILYSLVQLHRQLEQRVKDRTAELEQAIAARDELQNKLFEVSRRERSTIGHELHDGLGQHLTAMSFAASHLVGRLSSESHPAAADAGNLVRMAQEGIAQTRDIARGLLLAAIEPDELSSKLEELTAHLQAEHGKTCTFEQIGDPEAFLDGARSSHLFYIAQEAALNALRHGRPTEVNIKLQATASSLELSVVDNGQGLPPVNQPKPGMGLRIMAHRAELLGGKFLIVSAPGAGVHVRCVLPLHRQPEPNRPLS